ERGLLYAAVTEPRHLRRDAVTRVAEGQGSLHLYDVRLILEGKEEGDTLLKPQAVLPLEGRVVDLLLSPDGRSLYVAEMTDPTEVRLGRLDTERRKWMSEVRLANQGSCALGLSPDGKSLYAAGGTGQAGGRESVFREIEADQLRVRTT